MPINMVIKNSKGEKATAAVACLLLFRQLIHNCMENLDAKCLRYSFRSFHVADL